MRDFPAIDVLREKTRTNKVFKNYLRNIEFESKSNKCIKQISKMMRITAKEGLDCCNISLIVEPFKDYSYEVIQYIIQKLKEQHYEVEYDPNASLIQLKIKWSL